MVSVIGTLSDRALTKFDQQVAAAAALSTSVSDAMVAMQENHILLNRLQQSYLEQAVHAARCYRHGCHRVDLRQAVAAPLALQVVHVGLVGKNPSTCATVFKQP